MTEKQRIKDIVKGESNAEYDFKHFCDDELTRLATAILEESFYRCPFPIDVWKDIMRKSRIEQLEAVIRLTYAEKARLNYCTERLLDRNEIVKGVYISD